MTGMKASGSMTLMLSTDNPSACIPWCQGRNPLNSLLFQIRPGRSERPNTRPTRILWYCSLRHVSFGTAFPGTSGSSCPTFFNGEIDRIGTLCSWDEILIPTIVPIIITSEYSPKHTFSRVNREGSLPSLSNAMHCCTANLMQYCNAHYSNNNILQIYI